ncbi:MAG: carboxymuconolactone decarboxylase family protein [Acidobacteriaceae bacterium]|nr:carboxymuconolactone decarboxylase family protein [Acidobacteriaceae bacterium]
MSIEQLQESLPAYAKDLKLNLSSVLRQSELTTSQTWGAAVASAMAAGNMAVYETIFAAAQAQLSPEALEAAKAAAAIMGMNNVYYRFQHLVENEKYKTIPARLRMNVIRTHGTDPVDFELWSLAVSAVNGCGQCIVAHERGVREKGVSEEAVAAVIRIASVIHAVAAVVQLEGVSAAAA